MSGRLRWRGRWGWRAPRRSHDPGAGTTGDGTGGAATTGDEATGTGTTAASTTGDEATGTGTAGDEAPGAGDAAPVTELPVTDLPAVPVLDEDALPEPAPALASTLSPALPSTLSLPPPSTPSLGLPPPPSPGLPPGLELHPHRGSHALARPAGRRRTWPWTWTAVGEHGPHLDQTAGAGAAHPPHPPHPPRRHRWRRLRLPVALVAVLAVLGAATWAVGWSRLLDVESVTVAGTSTLTPGQVLAAARVPVGTPLARVDTAAIDDRVAALAPVRSVTVTRRFPHTLVVRVTERTPAAIIVGDNGQVRLVDSTGGLYPPVAGTTRDLPVLVDSGVALDVGSVAAAVTVLDALPPRIRTAVVAVAVGGDRAVVLDLHAGRSRPTVVSWGAAVDTARKARVLAALLSVTRDPWLDVSSVAAPVSRSSVPAGALPRIPRVGRAATAL